MEISYHSIIIPIKQCDNILHEVRDCVVGYSVPGGVADAGGWD
jgi:hypothetical protein